jgi:hypothetical protein
VTLAAVREAMVSDLGAVADLRPVEYVQDQVTVNQAVIRRGEVQYHMSFGKATDTKHTYQWFVDVYANRSDPRSAQIALDGYCEPSALPNALEEGSALDAVTDYVWVKSATEVRQTTVGTTGYLMVTFEVETCE